MEPTLRQVSDVEIVAAKLRATAADLIRQAEALESTIKDRPKVKRQAIDIVALDKRLRSAGSACGPAACAGAVPSSATRPPSARQRSARQAG